MADRIRGDRHPHPLSVWAALAAAAHFASGCATIVETRGATTETTISEKRQKPEISDDAAFASTVEEALPKTDATESPRFEVSGVTYNPCVVVSDRVVATTTTTVRTEDPNAANSIKSLWFYGLVGAGIAGGGGAVLAAGESSTAGWTFVVIGGLLSLALPGAITGSIKAIDSEDVDYVTRHERKPERCNVKPTPGVPFRIVASADPANAGNDLASGTLDERGVATVDIDASLAERIGGLGPKYLVEIDGHPAGETGAFEAIYAKEKPRIDAEAEAQRQRIEQERRSERVRVEQQARRDYAARESAEGRCSDESVAAFQKILTGEEGHVEGVRRMGFGSYTLARHSIEVAQAGGTNLEFRTLMGGEYNFVAVSWDEIAIEVTDDKGYRATPGSILDRVDRGYGVTSVGQRLRINSRESVKISLTGRGCVLLMVYRRW